MKYIIILLLLIQGCSSGGGDEPQTTVVIQTQQPIIDPTYFWYGDSRCGKNEYIEHRDCVGGRALTNVHTIDTDYDVIVIHMGFNDMTFGVTPRAFGEHLKHLIYRVEYKIWCVLPTWNDPKHDINLVAQYRDEILAACTHTVDPQIYPLRADGIHYKESNFLEMYDVLIEILDSVSYGSIKV